MIDFEQKYKQLKGVNGKNNIKVHKIKENKYDVNINIQQKTYKLQLWENTRLKDIINQYQNQGYFTQNSQISVQINGRVQDQLTKTIQNIVSQIGQNTISTEPININLIQLNQNCKIISIINSTTSYDQRKSLMSNQSTKLPKAITTQQLKYLLQNLLKKQQYLSSSYQQFQKILTNNLKQYINIKFLNQIINQLLYSKINIDHIYQYISSYQYNQFHLFIQNIKKIQQKLTNIKNYNQFIHYKQDVHCKLMQLDKKQIQYQQWYNQILVQNNKMKTSQKINQQKSEISENQQKTYSLKKKKQKAKKKITNSIQQKTTNYEQLQRFKKNKNKTNHEQQQKQQQQKNYEKQQKQQKFRKNQTDQTQQKQSQIPTKIKTIFINQPSLTKQLHQLQQQIQHSQNTKIKQLQLLFSIRNNQLIPQFFIPFLDSLTPTLNIKNKFIFLFEFNNKTIFIAYTQGIYKRQKQIHQKKKNNAANIHQQISNSFEFVMLLDDQKIFQSTASPSLVSYDPTYLYIGNYFRLTPTIAKKIKLQTKPTHQIQFKDQDNQLSSIFRKQNKDTLIYKLEVFQVIFQKL